MEARVSVRARKRERGVMWFCMPRDSADKLARCTRRVKRQTQKTMVHKKKRAVEKENASKRRNSITQTRQRELNIKKVEKLRTAELDREDGQIKGINKVLPSSSCTRGHLGTRRSKIEQGSSGEWIENVKTPAHLPRPQCCLRGFSFAGCLLVHEDRNRRVPQRRSNLDGAISSKKILVFLASYSERERKT